MPTHTLSEQRKNRRRAAANIALPTRGQNIARTGGAFPNPNQTKRFVDMTSEERQKLLDKSLEAIAKRPRVRSKRLGKRPVAVVARPAR